MMNLSQIDLHIHAGIERPVTMDKWMEELVKSGRKVFGMLDHYELYLRPDEEYDAYLKRKGFPRWYSNGIKGFQEFCSEVRHQGKKWDVKMLLGLEVYHGDFPHIRPDFLEGLDFIGCHISKTESYEPWEDFLLDAATKLSHVAHKYNLIGVLFHPFDHSFWFHRHGNTPARGLTMVEEDKLGKFADTMAELDICIEINWGSDHNNLNQPIFLREYIPVIEALKKQQVKFWLGSDVHHSVEFPYEMDRLCKELGISFKDIWDPYK